jgi:AcrR family transcriptional regulator
LDQLVYTMPRPRYENIDPLKKSKLLEAAMKEFAANGYELASINRILDAAELSKGSFYYYFDDKLDLATTVFLVCGDAPATRVSRRWSRGASSTSASFASRTRRSPHPSWRRA